MLQPIEFFQSTARKILADAEVGWGGGATALDSHWWPRTSQAKRLLLIHCQCCCSHFAAVTVQAEQALSCFPTVNTGLSSPMPWIFPGQVGESQRWKQVKKKKRSRCTELGRNLTIITSQFQNYFLIDFSQYFIIVLEQQIYLICNT